MPDLFHYTSCGLDYVWLRNGYTLKQTPYGGAVAIHHLEELHRVIGLHLTENRKSLGGSEVRFLRKEMSLSQAELARTLGVGETTIRGWENDRTAITPPADRMLRLLYREQVEGNTQIHKLIEHINTLNGTNEVVQIELEETDKGWSAAA